MEPLYPGRDGAPDIKARLRANEQKDAVQDERLDAIETPPEDILTFITALDEGLSE